MLLRMVVKSLTRNPRMTAWLMLTLVACASLVTLFTTVTFDLDRQMAGTLRRLGANATAIPSGPSAADGDWRLLRDSAGRAGADLVRLATRIGVVEGSPVAVVLADPEGLDRMTPYWSLSGSRARTAGECMIGKRIAEILRLKPGMKLGLKLPGVGEAPYPVTGVVESGDDDEDKVFLPEGPPGESVRTSRPGVFEYALLSVPGGEAGIRNLNEELASGKAALQVKPIYQILHGEMSTLRKIALLAGISLAAVLLLVAIGISAAVMARIVERKKELALLQAIGARRRSILGFLLLESAVTGFAAVLAGFGVGTLVSRLLVLHLFRAGFSPSPSAFAFTALVTMGVSILTGGIGASKGLRIRPAVALKGE